MEGSTFTARRFLCAEKCKWGVDADHTAVLCTRPEEWLSHTWIALILNFPHPLTSTRKRRNAPASRQSVAFVTQCY